MVLSSVELITSMAIRRESIYYGRKSIPVVGKRKQWSSRFIFRSSYSLCWNHSNTPTSNAWYRRRDYFSPIRLLNHSQRKHTHELHYHIPDKPWRTNHL